MGPNLTSVRKGNLGRHLHTQREEHMKTEREGGQVGLTTKGQGAVCYKNLGDSTVCNVQSLYFICISEFH